MAELDPKRMTSIKASGNCLCPDTQWMPCESHYGSIEGPSLVCRTVCTSPYTPFVPSWFNRPNFLDKRSEDLLHVCLHCRRDTVTCQSFIFLLFDFWWMSPVCPKIKADILAFRHNVSRWLIKMMVERHISYYLNTFYSTWNYYLIWYVCRGRLSSNQIQGPELTVV